MDLRSKYGIFQKLSFERLYVSFLGLQPREQMMALILSGVLLVVVVLSPIVIAAAKLADMKETMIKSSQSLSQIDQKIGELGQVQSELDAFEAKYRQSTAKSISTSIEGIASEAGISGSIDAIKERPARSSSDVLEETGVDVRISKVSLKSLVGFLEGVTENKGAQLQIRSLQLKPRFKARNQIDANLDVVTYSLKREER